MCSHYVLRKLYFETNRRARSSAEEYETCIFAVVRCSSSASSCPASTTGKCTLCSNQAAGPSFACASNPILVGAVFKSEDSSLQPPTTVATSANCRPGTLVDCAPTLRAVSVPTQPLAPSRRRARNAASVDSDFCLLWYQRWQHSLFHKRFLIPPPTNQRKFCLLFCRSCCTNLRDELKTAVLRKPR